MQVFVLLHAHPQFTLGTESRAAGARSAQQESSHEEVLIRRRTTRASSAGDLKTFTG